MADLSTNLRVASHANYRQFSSWTTAVLCLREDNSTVSNSSNSILRVNQRQIRAEKYNRLHGRLDDPQSELDIRHNIKTIHSVRTIQIETFTFTSDGNVYVCVNGGGKKSLENQPAQELV